MERASQLLSDTCTRALMQAKHRLELDLDQMRLSFKDSFKYSLLHQGQIKVEIRTSTSFCIFEGESELPNAHGRIISEARLTDFLLGARRVQTHYQDLLKAKDANISSAWLLVTAYYCCFYSCIELLKFFDYIQIGFDREDLRLLETRSTGTEKAGFFQKNILNYIGRIHADKIVFESNGEKPHTAAWQHLHSALSTVFRGKSWPEIVMLLQVLSSPDLNPSLIRNNWNYRRPDYFGPAGEHLGREFKKLLGNPKGAIDWLVRNGLKAEQDTPSRIAALCEILAPSIIDVYNRIRTKNL